MLTYLFRRLLMLIPILVGISFLTFSLMLLIPGDPAAVLLGQEATEEAITQFRTNFGLDKPWYVRYVNYMSNVCQGDLGDSIFQNQPVIVSLQQRLGATLELAFAAQFLAVVMGLTLGVLAAIKRGTLIDTVSMLFAQLGISMPVYWLGILLMFFFAVHLGWLPAIGRGQPLVSAVLQALQGSFGPLRDSLAHLLMPALALGFNSAAIISRLARTSMLDNLNEDFVRTAYSKWLKRPYVIIIHVLHNALLPIISIIGLRFGTLIGGAVLTETIFGWPGLGQLTVSAIAQRDIPLVQGAVLVFALFFALINVIVDISYAVIDPRVRLR